MYVNLQGSTKSFLTCVRTYIQVNHVFSKTAIFDKSILVRHYSIFSEPFPDHSKLQRKQKAKKIKCLNSMVLVGEMMWHEELCTVNSSLNEHDFTSSLYT